jgi:hypothetical protein
MSFGWNLMFRKGAWDEFRRFALLQRQNVPSRVIMIDREVSKIGNIRVSYQRSDTNDKTSPMSERRIGIEVKKNSSLCKLLQAYIARGGNPFDISMFLKPDSFYYIDDANQSNVLIEKQPYGGVVYPTSKEDDDTFSGIDTSGWLSLWRYPPRKLGNKVSPWSDYGQFIGAKIDSSREWITQEIKELRNDLEARILKLCDLREQLLIEKEEILVGSIGDAVNEIVFDDRFSVEHHLFNIIDFMDRVFYELDEYGRPDRTRPRKDDADRPYPVLLGDANTGEEDFTALG